MNQLEKIDNSPAVKSDQALMIDLISDLAKSSEVSIEKMRAILDMKTEVFQMQAKMEYDSAMSRVQSLIKPVTKNKFNTQTKSSYATLDSILEEIVRLSLAWL